MCPLTDAQWARIEPSLPDRTPKRGGRWRDHRQVIDAIAFKYRTGTPWMDLPSHSARGRAPTAPLRWWISADSVIDAGPRHQGRGGRPTICPDGICIRAGPRLGERPGPLVVSRFWEAWSACWGGAPRRNPS
ncbi:transposase [Streptomyces sp. NPDC059851]|uniref:transposase n=1 Tax=Streptomyces sp. NPDC059851 TaxID=3346971 RepID=UPI003661C023